MKAHQFILLVAPAVIVACHDLHTFEVNSTRHQPTAMINDAAEGISEAEPMAADKPDVSKIFGKIQIVDSFPDYKVQVVDSFPDLKVQKVKSFPDKPGKWQIVDSFPDFKIQIVDSFPDFKIQYVDSFPGVP